MSLEYNKKLVSKFYEAIANEDYDALVMKISSFILK